MSAYLVRRIIGVIPTVLGIATIIFFLMYLIPGDPVRVILGQHGDAETRLRITREMGLDQPIIVQYGYFLKNLATGDLGTSYRNNQKVADILLDRMPATLLLAITSVLLSVCLGMLCGIFAAVRQNKIGDVLIMILSLIGISTPVFWLGLLLILIFASKGFDGSPVLFGILPVSGYGEPGLDRLRHLILPALSLSAVSIGYIARMTRSSILEVIRQDYIRTAAAKGLPYSRIILKHALRNALIPVITIVGLNFAGLLGGAVATETVFSWPGIGKVVVDAIRQLDGPVVVGGVMLLAFVFVIVNLIVDITYSVIDPRIRLERD
ncbi:ABC transporter permease [bacterium]|nr:ABC transporter permease [candidate division CSSED10-310 bacterium]